MIDPGYVRTMAAYNAEMNRRVFGAALRLPDEERRADRGAFWGSIHATLCHIYWGDRLWMSRFGLGEAPPVTLAESGALVEIFDELWLLRQGFDAEMIGWAARLDPAVLEGDLVWWSGATQRNMMKPRALCMIQVFNHQAHHRGQVHALLTRAGETTGATDLPLVL